MSRLPTMSKSNKPKEKTAFDMANAHARSQLTGLDDALRVVTQTHKYDGGQIDLFPDELINISSLFIPKVRG